MAASILPREAVRRISTDEANRLGLKIRGPHGLLLVSEAGLYELIARSDKPEARAFKDRMLGEVMPTIPQRRRRLQDGRLRPSGCRPRSRWRGHGGRDAGRGGELMSPVD